MLTIDFIYDVVSPYAYLAFEIFDRYITAKRWELKLNLIPVYQSGVMNLSGNTPPSLLPSRGSYLVTDVYRCYNYFGVKLSYPDSWVNSLLPMRFLTAVSLYYPQHLHVISKSFWARYWSEGKNINTRESIEEICNGQLLPKEVFSKCIEITTEVKKLLTTRTEEFVKQGGYGVPTYFVTKENKTDMFFGSDRFPVFAQEYSLPWDGPFPKINAKFLAEIALGSIQNRVG